jgi:hypothetical protein
VVRNSSVGIGIWGFGFVPGRTIKQNGDRFAAGGVVAGGLAGKGRVLNDSRLSESGSSNVQK